MKGLIEWLDKHFVPVAGRIGSERHLVAIRNGFVTIMPIIIAGALAVLINNLPIPAYQSFMKMIFGAKWTDFGGNVWNGTFAVMSLMVIFTISYHLAESYDSDGLAAGVVSFGSLLMIYTGSAKDWAIPYAFLGAQGLFVALAVALVSTEIFVRLMRNKRLVIKMPDLVPPAVSRSFAALFPALITLFIFGLFKCLLTGLGVSDFHQLIFKVIQAPLTGLADTLGSALLVVFLVHLLWFFGLHGTNILLPITTVVYTATINDNIAALKAGAAIPHIVTSPFFDAFIYMGGAGTSICLIIAIFIAAKRKENRSIANLSAAMGCFNINEPMLFGVPLVLNPLYVIPFILTPLVLTLTSYGAIASGLVPKTISAMPWTTPPIIGGFLVTGSWRGGLLALVNIVIGVVIYLPFVIAAEAHANNLDKENAKAEVTEGKTVKA